MNKTIKEIGTFKIESLNVAEGCIEMRMPVDVISKQLDAKLDEVFAYYKTKNPTIKNEDICFEARLVFQFGRLNPDVSLMLIIFDKDEKGIDEIWDELKVTISDADKKQLKKIAWEKLGDVLFEL